MATPLTTLKNWFKTGLKPTQPQFWAVFDSFRHKDDAVPAADVSGLQLLLDGKMDKKAITATIKAGTYVPGQAYVYDALVPEYVSFSNPASPNPDFVAEGWYRLTANATGAQTPETNPEIWKYNGRTLGDMTIEDVFGLREELDDLRDSIENASSLTPEQIANIEEVPTLKNSVRRILSFNSLSSIICRDHYATASSITDITLSGASAIEYSTDNITFTPITLPLTAALAVTGAVWWRITYASGQETATVTINGTLNG